MKLSEQIAIKYARYRYRFLEGSQGVYAGPQHGVYDAQTDQYLVAVNVVGLPPRKVPSQSKEAPVTFLRNLGRPHDEPGAFVIAEKLDVNATTATEPGNLDTASITVLKHGDNTLHASWAFTTFIAEYVITHDLATLRIADSVLRSFQRLGNYSNGHGEAANRANRPANEFWGYILRSDVVDDDASNERIQTWLSDPDAKSPLEPSPDQYTSLFCACSVATRLLSEAQATDPDFPTSPEHVQLINGIRERMRERTRACHRYIAQHCRYLLKHPTGRMVKRGGWCWQFSYEFADVVSTLLNEDFDDHFEPFLLSLLPDILSAFVPAPSGSYADANAGHMADLILDGIEDLILNTSVAGVRDSIFSTLTAPVPVINQTVDLLSFLSDHSELKTDVDGAIRTAIRNWIASNIRPTLKQLLKVVIQGLLDTTEALDRAASKILARLLFRIFSDLFFSNNIPALQAGGKLATTIPASVFFDLKLFDPAALAQNIEIDVQLDIVTKGFTVRILGIEKSIGEIQWGSFHLQANMLPQLNWSGVLGAFQVPIAINAAEAIHRVADYHAFDDNWIVQMMSQAADLNPFKGDFFPFGYFVLMAVNKSFGRNGYAGAILSEAFKNGFFAALDYRLNSQTTALHILQEQVGIAPDGFPNGRSETIWDEDFLWLRDRQPGDDPSDKLFSGLDFLSALSIAASANFVENRKVLRDAIEKVLEEKSRIDVPERDGVFNLPFRGPIAGLTPVFVQSPAGLGEPLIVYVSVVFKTPGAPGRVRIRVANTGTASDVIEFRQNQPGKAVAVPFSSAGISIESADAGISAVLVVAVPKSNSQ